MAIARVLARGARLLLADELNASLDPASARLILQTLREVAHRDGIAVLCSLHQSDLALDDTDRIIGIKAGRIAFDAAPRYFGEREHEAM